MPDRVQAILKLEVPILVQIGDRRMHVRDVTALTPGSILELSKPIDDDLEILVNNKSIGAGRAVKVGENFGVEVTYIGDLKARIRALGSNAAQQPKGAATEETVETPEGVAGDENNGKTSDADPSHEDEVLSSDGSSSG